MGDFTTLKAEAHTGDLGLWERKHAKPHELGRIHQD